MARFKKAPLAEKWSDLFDYDQSTGFLLWNTTRGRSLKGSRAGSVKSDGRYITLQTMLNGVRKRHSAHRIIWEMLNGKIPKNLCIDHIDGNGLNNKINNLRVVSLSINQRNSKLAKNNKTGLNGVSRHSGGYTVNAGGNYIGYSKDFFEACCYRKSAELKLNYHANNGRI